MALIVQLSFFVQIGKKSLLIESDCVNRRGHREVIHATAIAMMAGVLRSLLRILAKGESLVYG